MKKKVGILLFSFLLAFLFIGCNEVLSVVTVDENGEKVVNNYVSMFENKVYDENISIKSWQEIKFFGSDCPVDMDELLFSIVNKKEKIVVLGDEETAVEIKFFDEGYNYKLFASAEEINRAINKSIDCITDF